MHRFIISFALAAAFLVSAPALGAETLISANDLAPAALAAPTAFGPVTILASSDKGVTIEAIPEGRTAPDQEVFNLRIKLNGSGSVAARALKLTAKGPATLALYLNSSSGTDARVLKVVDASGAVVGEIAAPADDKVHAGFATFTLEKAGDYILFSANSGINLYRVDLR